MIQVETTLITGSCMAWIDKLRAYRQELNRDLASLQRSATGLVLSRDQLMQVEQLHNQVHIQQYNIHELKHLLKAHLKKTDLEMNRNNAHLKDDTMAQHEGLGSSYRRLVDTLDDLQERLGNFLRRVPGRS